MPTRKIYGKFGGNLRWRAGPVPNGWATIPVVGHGRVRRAKGRAFPLPQLRRAQPTVLIMSWYNQISDSAYFGLCRPAEFRHDWRVKTSFIVIEGIDGTGKSTQVRRLAEWFEALGREVVVSREPTDGPWGKRLRESAASGRLSPEAELEYFLNDRRQHVAEVIAPALAAGKVVILDRYYFSTMAYQGARGFDPAEIRHLNEAFAPVPDLLLILDLEVAAAHGRIGVRGDVANAFEQRENLERCRQIFLSLEPESFVRVIPCDGDIDEVTARLQQAIRLAGLAPAAAG